ncbi:MAG TPA: stage II sporulation protein M [Candidatus Dorea intestinigallinarum]|nr:stage II sporulation protein M [Candidatus Dorea intestinigallinarum]
MRSYGKIFLPLCLAGFVGGILYANTGARDHILAAGIFSDYFLEQYTQAEIQTQDYFWYILSVRAGLLGVIALMGQMKKLRRWIVAAVLVWTGFLGGLFFTAAVIKLGPVGILFCLAAIIPQALFYIAGYGIVLWYFYSFPRASWNSAKTVGTILTIGVGIISESYLNPIFLKIFLKTI